MEFEASEPIDGSFASRGDILKDFVLGDAAVVADFERSRVHEADATALTKTRAQISTHWHEGSGYPFHKALSCSLSQERLVPILFGLSLGNTP